MWRLTANPAQARRGPRVAGGVSQSLLGRPRCRNKARPDRRDLPEERVRTGRGAPTGGAAALLQGRIAWTLALCGKCDQVPAHPRVSAFRCTCPPLSSCKACLSHSHNICPCFSLCLLFLRKQWQVTCPTHVCLPVALRGHGPPAAQLLLHPQPPRDEWCPGLASLQRQAEGRVRTLKVK